MPDIAEVVAKASEAYKSWSGLDISERIKYIKRLQRVIREKSDEIIKKIIQDTGKPRFEALVTEFISTDFFLGFYIKNAKKFLKPRKTKTPYWLLGKSSYIRFEPLGVIVILAPWNFPFHAGLVPAISALIPGNTVILKPSEYTPIIAELINELKEAAKFPEGVFQVVSGGKKVGEKLMKEDIKGVFLTGSSETGKRVMKKIAHKLIPVVMELGGKDAAIVCEDAPVKRAAKGIVWGSLLNAGQLCLSIERIYVEEKIYEKFKSLVKKEVENLTFGSPTDWNVDIGLLSSYQEKIVKEQIEDALRKGAKLVYKKNKKGFFPVIILEDVDEEAKLMKDETFGPLVVLKKVKDWKEAVELANRSRYGLGASVWSRDLKKAKKIVSMLEAGNVAVNDVVVSFSNCWLPFGGIKESGIGRYHGAWGLYNFCNIKSVIVDKGRLERELYWYPYRGKYLPLETIFKGLWRRNLWDIFVNLLKLGSVWLKGK